MDVKKYEVLDETGCVIATGMSLITALMVMEALWKVLSGAYRADVKRAG